MHYIGRALTLLFGIFTVLILLCYTCNLRANLLRPQFEKRLKTLNDVADRGEAVYIPGDFREFKSV